jgi:hypothetical protein
MTLFPKMVDILSPGKSGDAEITHFTVSKAASEMTSLRAHLGLPVYKIMPDRKPLLLDGVQLHPNALFQGGFGSTRRS